ncbi:hypothetical protein CKM354_000277800 [Cercospora kikuchii]|uniref:Reverse transcriptase n=1 Tax=Cercospora kikuchii TaxID=84275 RepID=A0A9P3FD42_9PEZI|nr:uncharacterized protein CKM354_000277800 [Cercospora kikuchii]GIZ39392.1 hypothetical protein CKM354_000277800 [Cercospora kikuchii]
MAVDRPLPPFLPETESQFSEHAATHPSLWYAYFQSAYRYIDEHDNGQDKLANELVREQIRASETQEALQSARTEISQLRAVIDFQKSSYEEKETKFREELLLAKIEVERALHLAQPIVQTPPSLPADTRAKKSADPTPRTTPPTPAAPTESSQRSEKLPDPEKFTGDRKDLRRFVSQIHEKMFVNCDRFATPQSRISYVTSRLSGIPYSQILPYIKDGICQLPDYQNVLQILDNAYGDPNRVNNARADLFRFRQTNKDFAAFFAEFQRLGLEAEMTEESLSTLLEQAVSNEIKQMLVHSPPPTREYLKLAAHLQDLENRRRYYNQTPAIPNPRTLRPTTPPAARNEKTYAAAIKERSPDPMDLDRFKRNQRTDKETGNCFRCHKPGHQVKHCTEPDTRPSWKQFSDEQRRAEKRRANETTRTASPLSSRGRSPPQLPLARSPSPNTSEKGREVFRISATALRVPHKFDRSVSPKVQFTTTVNGSEISDYALLDTGCEAYGLIDLQWATESAPCESANIPKKNVVFRLTKLGGCPMILGYPWMEGHSVNLSPANATLLFDSPYCQSHCNVSLVPAKVKVYTRKVPRLATRRKNKLVDVCNISFRTASLYAAPKYQRKGYRLCYTTIEDLQSIFTSEEKADIEGQLPECLRDFSSVFSPKLADQLPPHRPYDHDIKLKEGAEPPFGPLYGMSRDELQALKEWLDENLKKGFIRPSSSPVASPVLFVKKPGGGLRLCVDYRAINELTVKDRYPLPLTTETLNNLSGMKYFTKIDIISAFNNVRMKEGQEYLTAFRTRFGLFESLVMPFGLTGAPGTFQRFINDTLREFLDQFCSAYLDDILIYSRTREEHEKHVRAVLQKLHDAGLYAKLSKCEFFQHETKFLGMIVGQNGIRMDPEKIQTIQNWPEPKNVTDVQSYLGFANFYRRFIRNFSKICQPLTALTRKDTPFAWTPACQKAFDDLKQAFVEGPILAPFDWTKEVIVETDASDYVSAGILPQYDNEGILRPIAFFSKKHSPAECNYEIYDKELLAIIRCFEEWRPELEGAEHPIKVLSDHKNLEYFTTTKQLNRRQARWSEFLSRFRFQITYRPGKQGQKPDSLTRRSGDLPKEGDERLQHQSQTILKRENLPAPRKQKRVSFSDQVTIYTLPTPEPQLYAFPIRTREQSPPRDAVSAVQIPEELQETIRQGYRTDETLCEIIDAIREGKSRYPTIQLAQCELREDLLFYRNRLYVPNNEELYDQVLRLCHETPAAGHPGRARTYQIVSRDYYWPGMSAYIRRWVQNCHVCSRIKPSRQRNRGLLQPLPTPDRAWDSISMDFITHLPKSEGFDAIFVVVDRLTKLRHYVPCLTTDGAEEIARLFVKNIFRLHGKPINIVSDRDAKFMSDFWKHLTRKLRITCSPSTAYHPQTDGQTERLNAVLEQHLRAYVSYLQDDWVEWLPLAEFSANSVFSETTGLSPFLATYGFQPLLGTEVLQHTTDAPASREAESFVADMKAITDFLKAETSLAQSRYEEAANRHRSASRKFSVGEEVWLDARNIKTLRPTKKLDWKNLGPFRILEVKPYTCRLDLPATMKLHPVFNNDLLTPAANNPHGYQRTPPPPPVIVDGVEEWEIEEIVDSKVDRRGRGGKERLRYVVKWKGYDVPTTEPADTIIEDVPHLVRNFHRRYPLKPAPRQMPM